MKYVIYGAGGNCYHLISLLQNEKFNIIAIIDKRAGSISKIQDIPVYTLDEFECADVDNTVVLISIKNVFEHINVARTLLEKGFYNLVYKPFPILQGEHDEEWDSISDAYDKLLVENVIPDESADDIYASRTDHMMVFGDELFVKSQEDDILCWLPMELLCNYNRDDPYGRMPMGAYYPLLNLYKYLLNDLTDTKWNEVEKDLFLYGMEWVDRVNYEFTDDLKKSMLHSRLGVFNEMQKKSEIDKDFFVRNSVSVKCGEQLQFYLSTSGRNRVTFLLAKGYRFVPVHMSEQEYKRWINEEKFKKFKAYLEKNRINRLFSTIPHPMFQSYDVVALDYSRLFCMQVIMHMYRIMHWKAAKLKDGNYKIDKEKFYKLKEKIKIFASIDDGGCVSRLIAMGGMHCYRNIEHYEDRKLCHLEDELMYMENNEYLNEVEDVSKLTDCDVWVTDSRNQLSNNINQFSGDIIFLLQWGNDKCQCIYDGYSIKKTLFRTLWNEQNVCGVMLTK
jgi:hypothetical protein